jgi:hypothetical protein
MAGLRHPIAATRTVLVLGVIACATAAPASAQIDISGTWISSEENLRPRGNAGRTTGR